MLKIEIESGMKLNVATNTILKFKQLEDQDVYHLFLVLRLNDIEDILIDTYYRNPFELQDVFTSEFKMKTEHNTYQIIHYSSHHRSRVQKILKLSQQDNNIHQWIKQSLKVKVKPIDMDYHNLVDVFQFRSV